LLPGNSIFSSARRWLRRDMISNASRWSGVVSADSQLSLPDFPRGRAHVSIAHAGCWNAPGRGALPGEVLVETYYPEHYAIQLAARQDYIAFFEKRKLQFPALCCTIRPLPRWRAFWCATRKIEKCDPMVAPALGVSLSARVARRESAGPRRGAARTASSASIVSSFC